MKSKPNKNNKNQLRKIKNIIIAVIALTAVIAVTVSLYILSKTTVPQTPPLTFTVTRRDIKSTVGAAGDVVFLESSPVLSLEKYKVSEIYVKNGDHVKAGDKLFSYDPDELDVEIEKNREKLSEEEEKLRSSSAGKELEYRSDNLKMLLDNAKSQYANALAECASLREKLDGYNAEYDECVSLRDQYYDDMFASSDDTEYEKADFNYEQYRRKAEELSGKIESTQQLLSNAEDSAAQLEFSVTDAQLQLDKGTQMSQIQEAANALSESSLQALRGTISRLEQKREELTVYAETDGVITDCPEDKSGIRFNQIVMNISPENEFGVRLMLSADKSISLRPGMKIMLSTAASDENAEAVITSISSTGSSIVYIYATIGKEYCEQFRYGMDVYGIIITNEIKDYLAVPYESVLKRDDGDYVVAYFDDGTEKLLKIKKEMEAGYYIAVESDELAENTVILLDSDDYREEQ